MPTVVGVAINRALSLYISVSVIRNYFKGRNFFANMVIVTMLFTGYGFPTYILVANVLNLRKFFLGIMAAGNNQSV